MNETQAAKTSEKVELRAPVRRAARHRTAILSQSIQASDNVY